MNGPAAAADLPEHLTDLPAKARDAMAGVLLAIENQAAEIERLGTALAREIDAHETLQASVIGLDSLRSQLHNFQRYCIQHGLD